MGRGTKNEIPLTRNLSSSHNHRIGSVQFILCMDGRVI